jgi:prepilin-type N-terminal cleavage/methylation domain-containing protein
VRSLRDERGFSLVEMVAVMLILGIVLGGLTTVFVSGTRAEMNVNNRFQAQQTARLAMGALRNDTHSACASNVPSTAKLVLAFVPTSNDVTTCGATGSSAAFPKAIYCALASPTISTQYALYRSTATDSTCTTGNGTLIADGLTANALFSLSTAAPTANCAAGTICVMQVETISATIPISFQQGTQFGAPYTLAQTLALRNGVYQTTNATTACLTVNSTCVQGTCLYNTGKTCYPPAIQ